jgi:hypothetical protein
MKTGHQSNSYGFRANQFSLQRIYFERLSRKNSNKSIQSQDNYAEPEKKEFSKKKQKNKHAADDDLSDDSDF